MWSLAMQETDTLDVNADFWVTDPWSIKHQRIAYMQSRGPGCLDHRYYLKKNPDVALLKHRAGAVRSLCDAGAI